MGVKHLWELIEEAKEKNTLECLRGKIVTVDLSIWIVEATRTLQFKTSILKPHLRNLFFRVHYLRKLGVKLIFVTEGEPPDLKQNTMKQRNFERFGVKNNARKKVGRSRFQRTINECCELLDLLGIPHVRAAGEAEQMCAFLNQERLSHGCLTNDGDFFLYGGKTVYRDFGIDPKDPHVLTYSLNTVTQRSGLARRDLIAIALLFGCDYTSGVNGVGKGLLMKWLEEKDFAEDLLSRFDNWFEDGFFRNTVLSKTEIAIAKKAMKNTDFPDKKVVDEFLLTKDHLDGIKSRLKWRYPDVRGTQEFLLEKMEWPMDYSLAKVLQLASSTYLEKLNDGTFYDVPISPNKVLKTRCHNGTPLVEVEWLKQIKDGITYNTKWRNCPDTFVTLENQAVVLAVLPALVEEFTSEKRPKKKGVKSQPREMDELRQRLSELPLKKPVCLDVLPLSERLEQRGKRMTSKSVCHQDALPVARATDNVLYHSPCLVKQVLVRERNFHANRGDEKAIQSTGNDFDNSIERFTPIERDLPSNNRNETAENSALLDEQLIACLCNLDIDSPIQTSCPDKIQTTICEEEIKTTCEPLIPKSVLLNSDIVPLNPDIAPLNHDIAPLILDNDSPIPDSGWLTPVKSINTPVCFDTCTPQCINKPSVLKDTSNFSLLGDSILLENAEASNGACISTPTELYEKMLRKKFNLSSGAATSCDSLHENSIETALNVTCSPVVSSPLSLAERLKLRMMR